MSNIKKSISLQDLKSKRNKYSKKVSELPLDDPTLWYSPNFNFNKTKRNSEMEEDDMQTISEGSHYSADTDFEASNEIFSDSSKGLPKILKMSDLPESEETSSEKSLAQDEEDSREIPEVPEVENDEKEADHEVKNIEKEFHNKDLENKELSAVSLLIIDKKEKDMESSIQFNFPTFSSINIPSTIPSILDHKEEENIPLEDQIKRMEEEVLKQEQLIQGYQTENEKLYTELKDTNKSHKLYISKLEAENQTFRSKLAFLKEQTEKESRTLLFQSMGITNEVEQFNQDLVNQLQEQLKERTEKLDLYEQNYIQLLEAFEALKVENEQLKKNYVEKNLSSQSTQTTDSETNWQGTADRLQDVFQSALRVPTSPTYSHLKIQKCFESKAVQCSFKDCEVRKLQLQLDKANQALVQMEYFSSEREAQLLCQIQQIKKQLDGESRSFLNNVSVFEMANELDTQKIICNEMRVKLTEAETFKKECFLLIEHNEQLNLELNNLKKEVNQLSQPKQTLLQLQEAIRKIEAKFSAREQRLDCWIGFNNVQETIPYLNQELARCKNLVQIKDNQIKEFQAELDQIVIVLETLKEKHVRHSQNNTQND